MFDVLKNLFDSNEKQVGKINPLVAEINEFEDSISKLTDDQIKEKTNQRIYETPKHRIWSRSVFDNYVTDLNARLALPLEQSIPMVEEAVATSSTARILGQVPAKKNYFFLVVTTFLLSAVLGFFWRRIVNFAVLTANRTTCEPLYEELV